MKVHVEIGKKRTFAGAIDWPGWCRSGVDEDSALQALLEYAPRYARAVETAQLEFSPPGDISGFKVVERLRGNAGTDFGAPNVAPASDAEPVGEAELKRLQALMQAIWGAFDAAVKAAEGAELRTGPRGGGRDLEGILRHVLEADTAYLSKLGGKFKWDDQGADPRQGFSPLRQAVLPALEAAARGEVPEVGPRGGLRWKPRFYVRYATWHQLDHAWEIEDRVIGASTIDPESENAFIYRID